MLNLPRGLKDTVLSWVREWHNSIATSPHGGEQGPQGEQGPAGADGAGAALGAPALTLGTANAAGVAATAVGTDATIAAFDATSPTTQAFGDAAATGSAAVASRRDHKHAMMADPVTAHVAAGDPHTGYVKESDANYVDLTDGGATTLHTHAGGSGHTIRESGVDMTARTGLNFIDAGNTALVADDAANNETEITLNGYALLAGRSGGQTLKGGTAASENLLLAATAHATLGSVLVDGRLCVGADPYAVTGGMGSTHYGHSIGNVTGGSTIHLNIGVSEDWSSASRTMLRANSSFNLIGNVTNFIGIQGSPTIGHPNTDATNRTMTAIYGLDFQFNLNNLSTTNSLTVTDVWAIRVRPDSTSSAAGTMTVTNWGGLWIVPTNSGGLIDPDTTISGAYRSIYCNFTGTARSTTATRHLDLTALASGTAQCPIYEQGSTAGDTHGNRLKSNTMIGSLTGSFGTSADGVLSVANPTTAPTGGPTDAVVFYSSDDAAGHTIPSFYCEGTNVVATGQADSASSVRVKMRINGTVRTFLCI